MKYFRIHPADIAYRTGQPRGLFTAVGRLVDGKVMTEREIAEYWENRQWFEANLPVPPFYEDDNSIKAVTWYKNNRYGNDMCGRMDFYRRMAGKYGLALYRSECDTEPGDVVYEDEFQIGVVSCSDGGAGVVTSAYGG